MNENPQRDVGTLPGSTVPQIVVVQKRRLGPLFWVPAGILLLLLAGGIAVVAVIGFASVVPAAAAAKKIRSQIGVAGFEFEDRAVVGIVTNAAPHRWRYVKVQFGLYDQQGLKLGTAMDIVEGLGPNQAWKFRAVVTEKSATTARLQALDAR